ncbi:MAG TPA: PIN domain-containing protein [Microvirga sp.]|jgi:hypothetical protein|nr:PIN domain-containing protein [Microvirga sp.]
MAAFVDSNVVIDVLAAPSAWRAWSTERLLEWVERGPLIVNDIVYAEVSVGFEEQALLDRSFADLGLERRPMSPDVLFAAGKAFRRYRQSRGSQAAILPDFLIGAHAAALGTPLITRDPRRFGTYFPTLTLVTP